MNFSLPRPGLAAIGALFMTAAFSLALQGCAQGEANDAITLCEPVGPCDTKLPVKVVIVTMFEIGEDMGDTPGEFQLWRERRGLDMQIPFPHSFHDLYYNPETQLLAIVTGIGTAKSASATMALGLDPRFDLTQSYWLVAGIAGIDPEDASIGSAAWSSYLVDGDLSHEIDAREKPADWPDGYFARYTQGPNDPVRPEPTGELFIANPGLRDWAFDLTKDLVLPDTEEMQVERAQFVNHPNAQKAPFVLKGEHLAAMTFWHGELMNEWANRWTDYWTDGKGEFVTSAMEDTGTATSLQYLDKLGVVDADRFMVLRAGSNYTMPPPGFTAAEYLLRENEGFAGLVPSVESLYLVGGTVIDELLGNWDIYADCVPGGEQACGL